MTGALSIVYERLGVRHAHEVWLDDYTGPELGAAAYVAWSGSRLAIVDRPLAVKLRADGVPWAGEILRDPCAVA